MSAGTSHAPPYKCLLRHSRRSRRQALLALLTERAPSLSGLSFGISTGAFGNPYPRLAPGRPHIRLVPSRPLPSLLANLIRSALFLICRYEHASSYPRRVLITNRLEEVFSATLGVSPQPSLLLDNHERYNAAASRRKGRDSLSDGVGSSSHPYCAHLVLRYAHLVS
jgi:hypothetical protein